MVTDTDIKHWYEVYEAHGLFHRHGILFATFVLMPEEILETVATLPADHQPLLPAQACTMHELSMRELEAQQEAELDQLPGTKVRNGCFVQTLHRHSFAVSGDRDRRLRP